MVVHVLKDAICVDVLECKGDAFYLINLIEKGFHTYHCAFNCALFDESMKRTLWKVQCTSNITDGLFILLWNVQKCLKYIVRYEAELVPSTVREMTCVIPSQFPFIRCTPILFPQFMNGLARHSKDFLCFRFSTPL